MVNAELGTTWREEEKKKKKKLFKAFKAAWPRASEWSSMVHIKPTNYHGGDSYNGPSCQKLLKSIDQIDRLARENNAYEAQIWVAAFRSLKEVIHACFGMKLESDFKEKIQRLKELCKDLPIFITPKLHILFNYVPQFINSGNEPLGSFAEQTSESVHHNFRLLWSQRYRRETIHPDYENQLLRSIVEYNSKHV